MAKTKTAKTGWERLLLEDQPTFRILNAGSKKPKYITVKVISKRVYPDKQDMIVLYTLGKSRTILHAPFSYSEIHNHTTNEFDRDFFENIFTADGDEIGLITKNNVALLDADHNDALDFIIPTFKAAATSATLVSFECIANLWAQKPKDIEGFIKSVEVIDFTQDQKVRLTKNATKRRVKTLFNQGYSVSLNIGLINKHLKDLDNPKIFDEIYDAVCKSQYSFHKAGMVLIKYKDDYGLFGFDDGQYFGCLLPKDAKPTTCNQAIEVLKPKGVGKQYQRQGEWFICSANIDPSSMYTGCLNVDGGHLAGYLPLETPDSNPHEFTANNCVVYPDYMLFEDLKLRHDEHPTVRHKGWCKVVKNTAVRSVSVEGVD